MLFSDSVDQAALVQLVREFGGDDVILNMILGFHLKAAFLTYIRVYPHNSVGLAFRRAATKAWVTDQSAIAALTRSELLDVTTYVKSLYEMGVDAASVYNLTGSVAREINWSEILPAVPAPLVATVIATIPPSTLINPTTAWYGATPAITQRLIGLLERVIAAGLSVRLNDDTPLSLMKGLFDAQTQTATGTPLVDIEDYFDSIDRLITGATERSSMVIDPYVDVIRELQRLNLTYALLRTLMTQTDWMGTALNLAFAATFQPGDYEDFRRRVTESDEDFDLDVYLVSKKLAVPPPPNGIQKSRHLLPLDYLKIAYVSREVYPRVDIIPELRKVVDRPYELTNQLEEVYSLIEI